MIVCRHGCTVGGKAFHVGVEVILIKVMFCGVVIMDGKHVEGTAVLAAGSFETKMFDIFALACGNQRCKQANK